MLYFAPYTGEKGEVKCPSPLTTKSRISIRTVGKDYSQSHLSVEIEQGPRNRTHKSEAAVIPPGTESIVVCGAGISCWSSNEGGDQCG